MVAPKFFVCVKNWFVKINNCCKFEVKLIPISGARWRYMLVFVGNRSLLGVIL